MDYWKSRTLLELDDPRVTPKERADGIRSMITDHVMPMFRQCDTNTGLREFLIANREIYNWASAMLKSFLDLPDPHWLKEYANEPKPPPFSHQYAELFNNILHQRRK